MAVGLKTGGRQRGTPNKRTIARTQAIIDAAQGGMSPLEYLLGVMRGDVDADKDKLQAAVAAAPYIHPRLSNIEAHTTADVHATHTVKRDATAEVSRRLGRLAPSEPAPERLN